MAELLAWGRHSCLPIGATFQSPRGRTGKSGEPAGWKACPTLIGAESQALNFGIQVDIGGHVGAGIAPGLGGVKFFLFDK